MKYLLAVVRALEIAVVVFIGCSGILVICVVLFLGTENTTPSDVRPSEFERQSNPIDASISRADWPDDAHPPTMTVDVKAPFGLFRIPIGNYLYRRQLYEIGFFPSKETKHADSADAKLFVRTFGLALWMPDGGFVATEASSLINHIDVEPLTLERRRNPFRPREEGRPDPTSRFFVAAVATFCPPVNHRPRWPDDSAGAAMGATPLSVVGYGYGAMEMLACWEERPDRSWSIVSPTTPGGPAMFCRPSDAPCFGWVDLPFYHVRGLLFIPKDAVTQAGAVADELRILLNRWQVPDEPGPQ